MLCPSCAFDNPAGFRFCGGCGATLQPTAAVPTPSPEPGAERRQLTVLFCDLVGSTALAEELDPEELRGVVREYQATCSEVIRSYEGHVAQYLGDGLLVYFGYPRAHEDDPRRSVHAALGILAAMAGLNRRLATRALRLAVRVGIHTGSVVAGEVGAGPTRERLALGQAPNVAARLQGLAPPDTILLSEATYRLVRGFFTCEPLGPQELKGISRPVEVFQVLGEGEFESRFDLAVREGLSGLVGRRRELDLLGARFGQARRGEGQVVLLAGEAGIGKSRLVHSFKPQVEAEAGIWTCRCSPFAENSALQPMIDLFQRMLELGGTEPPEERFCRLEAYLRPLGLNLEETLPLLAALLSLPLGTGYRAPGLTPQKQKERTLEVLAAILLALAAERPLVYIVEDLHWIDPSTLEFLDLFVRRAAAAPVLVLFTFRPVFVPAWKVPYLSRLDLERLSDDEAKAVAMSVTGGKALPAEVLRQVVEKTDGVPLFLEELTKTVLESGLLREAGDRYDLAGPLPPLAIPATLQDSLTARLDRLSTARDLAQLGATLGRSFSYAVLRALSPLADSVLVHELARLVEAGLLFQKGSPPEATYVFKHALIQDAAYGSLLRSTRQQFHQRIAAVLLERFPETAEAQPELIAHHYTEAGLAAEAVERWHLAAWKAFQRSANLEAIAHCRRGLEVLPGLPEGAARDRSELDLQMMLGTAFCATRGYAAAEVEQSFARALELGERTGETPKRFWILWGLWAYYTVRSEMERGIDLAYQLLRHAEARQEPALLFEAHYAIGVTQFFVGDFAVALDHLEQGIALDHPGRDRSNLFLTGQDVGITTRVFHLLSLFLMGRLDQATAAGGEALALARQGGHPFSMALALSYAGTWLHHYRRDPVAVHGWAEEGITLSAAQGLFWGTLAEIHLGWARVHGAMPAMPAMPATSATSAAAAADDESLARMQRGLGGYLAFGGLMGRPYYFYLIAEAAAHCGRREEAERALAAALAAAGTGEHVWSAELYRLQGELALAEDGGAERAGSCFARALAVARGQGATLLELRAAASLGRLEAAGGMREEARRRLAEVYCRFAEGFETRDLEEARELLATWTDSCQIVPVVQG